MDEREFHQPRRRRHDNRDMLLMSLSDGARTLEELRENFFAFARRLGAITPVLLHAPEGYEGFLHELSHDLDTLVELGLVVPQEGKYTLTSAGRALAEGHLADVRKAANLARRLVQPQMVSQVGMIAHFVLAVIKLPAALLSGSIGLLNDTADTLLDGLSSLILYFGIRTNREHLANVVLVVMMLATGSLGFYQAVRRFFVPFEPEVDWFTFLSSILSGSVCLGLGLYQRYAGLKHGSLALITQSVDSRNHVITTMGVLSGLVASLLRFPLLDTLVGVGIAILIFKSGIELSVELVRSRSAGEVDLSRYQAGVMRWYAQLKQAQLRDWILYLVKSHRVQERPELIAEITRSQDFTRYPVLRAFGLGEQDQMQEEVSKALTALLERGWLAEEGALHITRTGKEHLRLQARRLSNRSFGEETW